MRFLVPQYIDVEPKVIGPITVRQFITCIVGGLFIFITYKLADFSMFIFFSIIEAIIFGTVAFLKINGKPFHFFFLNVLQTFKKPTARIWHKEEMKIKTKEATEGEKREAVVARRPLPTSRLSQISMVVNTGGAYQEEEE